MGNTPLKKKRASSGTGGGKAGGGDHGGGKPGALERSGSKVLDGDETIFVEMVQELWEEGNKLFQHRDYEHALLNFEKAVRLLPTSAALDASYLHSNLAPSYMQMSPPGRGITLCSTTLNSIQRSRSVIPGFRIIVCHHRRRGFHDGREGAGAWELLLSLAGLTTAESLTFGAFICIKCSGAHRSLGVHISKVVSVKLDEWTDEQVHFLTNSGGNDVMYLPFLEVTQRQDKIVQ